MNFLVTVACLAGMACPLPAPIHHRLVAVSHWGCIHKVEQFMGGYGVDPKQFSIRCDLRR